MDVRAFVDGGTGRLQVEIVLVRGDEQRIAAQDVAVFGSDRGRRSLDQDGWLSWSATIAQVVLPSIADIASTRRRIKKGIVVSQGTRSWHGVGDVIDDGAMSPPHHVNTPAPGCGIARIEVV